jgi:hypothetical protein
VDAHTAAGRQLGLSVQDLVEVAAVTDLFSGLCTLAQGLGLRVEEA